MSISIFNSPLFGKDDMTDGKLEKLSPAGRVAIVTELLNPPIYETDINGEEFIIGYGEPLISREEALRLLGADD